MGKEITKAKDYIRKELEVNLIDGDITLWGIEEDCEDGSVMNPIYEASCETAVEMCREYGNLFDQVKKKNIRIILVADPKTLRQPFLRDLARSICSDFS